MPDLILLLHNCIFYHTFLGEHDWNCDFTLIEAQHIINDFRNYFTHEEYYLLGYNACGYVTIYIYMLYITTWPYTVSQKIPPLWECQILHSISHMCKSQNQCTAIVDMKQNIICCSIVLKLIVKDIFIKKV